MSAVFQASLFDAGEEFELGDLARLARTELSDGAWVDVLPGWIRGADALFDRLVDTVPWHAERRPMYDRVVDVPRLLSFYGEGDALPDPALEHARVALDLRYGPELGESLCTTGMCLYRDGRDSVAWHGDTSGRRVTETIVAILSLGNPRHLMLRPRSGGGQTMRFPAGHGDLLVMGGTCQRTWEHAILKTKKAAGPRISVQFRPRGVR
jgi:alkylated DNA repair dioxygenase AlkB